jgi:hypothetical protein
MATTAQVPAQGIERLGPADRIISTCLAFQAHAYHGRPGMVVTDAAAPIGVSWHPVSHIVENGRKIVVALPELPKGPAQAKTRRKGRQPKGPRPPATRIGWLRDDDAVVHETTGEILGRYQAPGLFPEACAWLYRQVAEVWKLDNEFAGKWASYAYGQEHEDLKVVLCAFMLCQSRTGLPIMENGKRLFDDLNLRDVGRAMMLLTPVHGLNAKLVLRVRQLLGLPQVVAINRELGFAHGPKVARQWLEARERNPRMLDGLVRVGFGNTVRYIAENAEYKPLAPSFFQKLRWKQAQAPGGHRAIAVGDAITKGDTWEGMDERGICEAIERSRPDWKKIVGMLPREPGLTRAIMAAAIENNCLSDKDLVIASPTLEELGLLEVQEVKARWDAARAKAIDMRAAHVARNVTTKAVADELQDTADKALQRQVAEVVRGMRVFVFVDISGSMSTSIDAAKGYLSRFVQGFPTDKLHVAVFNTLGRQVDIPHASAAGVQRAFAGITAGGGTDYGAGIRALARHQGDASSEDNLFLFVGDEGAGPFVDAVERSALKPVAFGLLKVPGENGNCVTHTAARLGIPCFPIEPAMFEDAYAIPRTLRALIASAPVVTMGRPAPAVKRKTLVETILDTKLLEPPAWA